MSFWDTSALVKLYVRERDSDRFVELARKAETRAIISQLSIHEMRCVLHRKEFARTIPPDTAELAYRRFYDHVEEGSSIWTRCCAGIRPSRSGLFSDRSGRANPRA